MAEITIRDVAQKANVGVGTVSRVLNDHPSVRDATRQRILAAIEELNYTPNAIARRLSLQKTLSIAAIVPFFTRPAFIEKLRGVEYALASSEYDLVVFNVETIERLNDCLQNVPQQERFDGILIISASPRDEDVDYLLSTGVPTVLVDAYHPRLNRVVVDDVTGGYGATKHLINLGHRRIGFISDYLDNPFNFVAGRHRYTGYRNALAENDIAFNPDYHREGDYGRARARQLTRDLLTLANPPTAIFAVSDTEAIGVLEAARDLGLRVPGDLSVVGYDDIEIAEYLKLTTMRQPFFVAGVEGVELLLESIATPSSSVKELGMDVELIERETTSAANLYSSSAVE